MFGVKNTKTMTLLCNFNAFGTYEYIIWSTYTDTHRLSEGCTEHAKIWSEGESEIGNR